MSDSLFKSFTQGNCPRWRCPDCFNETLAIVPESFCKIYTAATTRFKDDDNFGAEHAKYVFSCMLRCVRADCQETVAVTGNGWIREDNDYDYSGQTVTTYTDYFVATTFFPALPLFDIPADCPEPVLDQLNEISSLMTGHPAAAANAIRSLLETLLDDLSIPREELRPGKAPRPLKLHDRLEKHKAMSGSHYDGMMALKIFGNAGSHGGSPIKQQHLEDACAVLELLINQLYMRKPDLSFQIERLNQAFAKKHLD